MSIENGGSIGAGIDRLPVWPIDKTRLPYEQMALNLVEHVEPDEESIKRAVRRLMLRVRRQHSKPQLATEYARGLFISAIYVHSPQYLSAQAVLDLGPLEIAAMNERENAWVSALEDIYPARSGKKPFGVEPEAFEHYQRARSARLVAAPKPH